MSLTSDTSSEYDPDYQSDEEEEDDSIVQRKFAQLVAKSRWHSVMGEAVDRGAPEAAAQEVPAEVKDRLQKIKVRCCVTCAPRNLVPAQTFSSEGSFAEFAGGRPSNGRRACSCRSGS